MTTTSLAQKTSPSYGRAAQLRFWLLLSGLTGLLFLSMTLGVTLGPVEIPVSLVWRIALSEILKLLAQVVPFESGPWLQIGENWSKAQFNIIWLIRFPRVLLAVFVGAGLSVV